jgi:hypothetical protein
MSIRTLEGGRMQRARERACAANLLSKMTSSDVQHLQHFFDVRGLVLEFFVSQVLVCMFITVGPIKKLCAVLALPASDAAGMSMVSEACDDDSNITHENTI